jgi:hypothetical protein
MEKIHGVDIFEKKLEDFIKDKQLSFVTDITRKMDCYIGENKTLLPSIMSNPLYKLTFGYNDKENGFFDTYKNIEVPENKWYIKECGYPDRKTGGEYTNFTCHITNDSYCVQKGYIEPYIDEHGNELMFESVDFAEDIPYDYSGPIGKLYTMVWQAQDQYDNIRYDLTYANERAFSKHIISCYHTCLKSLNQDMSSLLGYNHLKQQKYKLYICVIKLMLIHVKDEVDTLTGFDDEETNVTLEYYNNVEIDMNKILENLKRWPIETELMIRAITNRTNVASNEVCNMIKGFI